MKYLILLCVFSFASCSTSKNEYTELRNNINDVIRDKQATVGVALIVDGKDTLTVNNDYHYPTQSTYKFHLALAVLDYMDKNDIPLDHKLLVKKEEMLPNTWSPLRVEYPDTDFEMPISEILKYTVAQSDNNGCDVLFRFIGGPSIVDGYIRNLGMTDFAIATTEEEMHTAWDVQFRNWSTPYTAACVLEKFRTGNILPEKYQEFLWETMIETSTGANKIKALLPEGTKVAHKTGSSFRNEEGIRAADNDIAIIELPSGRFYALVIFVADSKENDETNSKIIADISKVVYDYLVINTK